MYLTLFFSQVLPEIAEISADSYVTTAVLGSFIFVLLGSIGFAARRGYVNIDVILETIYAEEVTIPSKSFPCRDA